MAAPHMRQDGIVAEEEQESTDTNKKRTITTPNRKWKSNGQYCAAIGCNMCRSESEESFFRFPKDRDRCQKWVINSRRADLEGKTPEQLNKSYVLCTKHFEDNQFHTSEKKKLNFNAVPTIFAVPNPPARVTSQRRLLKKRDSPNDSFTEMESDDRTSSAILPPKMKPKVPTTLSPSKVKLKKNVMRLRTKVYRMEQRLNRATSSPLAKTDPLIKSTITESRLITELSAYLSGPALTFVTSQIKMAKRAKTGKRWTVKDKSLALSLYHSSPRTYRLLRRIFTLPSESTLQSSMKRLNIQAGFSSTVFDALDLKVKSMTDQEKLCDLVFDEMVIKENLWYQQSGDVVEGFEELSAAGRTQYVANYALVFMLRGLIDRWKQPVGYFLLSGPVKAPIQASLLYECLGNVMKVGLLPKVIICDQGSNNQSMFKKQLKVTVKDPYIECNGQRVYVMYDPPHLIKSVRNNLTDAVFEDGDKEMKWSHIASFRALDSTSPIRLAPKLTDRHLDLPPFAAMKVKLATQLLSHSVAAGITFMVQCNMLPAEAQDTADFIEDVDQLFNAFNSSTVTSSQRMRSAIKPECEHLGFLENMRKMFSRLRVTEKKIQPARFYGWQLSIACLQQLWKDLSSNFNVSFLLTDRLNQDCLENTFGLIWGKGGHRDNPNATQFRTAFNQIVVESLMKVTRGANCQEDMDKFLLQLKSFTSRRSRPCHNDSDSDEDDVEISCPGLPDDVQSLMRVFQAPESLSLPEMNTYIAGFIARGLGSKLSCHACKEVLTASLDLNNDSHLFIKIKNYEQAKTGLTVPSEGLVNICRVCEEVYREHFTFVVHMNKISFRLYTACVKRMGDRLVLCGSGHCKPLNPYIISYFLKIRIHHSIRENNLSFATSKGRRNRKLAKLKHL